MNIYIFSSKPPTTLERNRIHSKTSCDNQLSSLTDTLKKKELLDIVRENAKNKSYSQVPNKRVYSFIPNKKVGMLF